MQTSLTKRVRFNKLISYDNALTLLTLAYNEIVVARIGIKPKEESLQHLKKVAKWMSDSNKKCGLLLCGTIGNGKTTTAKAIVEVLKLINKNEHWVTEMSAIALTKLTKDKFNEITTRKYLCVDDVGTEPLVMQDFGNKITPFIQMINVRYEKQLPIILTTNLTSDGILAHYDERVLDRLIEMCEKIVFDTESYRK